MALPIAQLLAWLLSASGIAPVRTSASRLLRSLVATVTLIAAGHAAAHDPFDGGTQVMLFEDRIESTVTLGTDAARAVLEALPLSTGEVVALTRPPRERVFHELPVALADKLIQLRIGGDPLKVSRFAVLGGDEEIVFLVVNTRPGTSATRLTVQAAYFAIVGPMRPGPVLVADGTTRRAISTALVSTERPAAEVPTVPGAKETASHSQSFVDFLQLGLEHVLSGTDHLLFLGALLLGTRRLKSMLVVISAFTLAHSITLAMAALGLVNLPARIVEPLIAASIVIVCLENMFFRGRTNLRYALTFTLGLIHGLGFADALKEAVAGASGAALGVPILAFNLGIEGGQLMVAAVAVPLLLLSRRHPVWDRRLTLLLSGVITLIALVWVWQRL